LFLVLLRFSTNRAQASQFMDGHNAWIMRGFEDGVFLLTGSAQPAAGGVIFAHNTSRAELETRLQKDPFVAGGVVTAEVLHIAPGRTDERLAFLMS
jgi:hypothetical protein